MLPKVFEELKAKRSIVSWRFHKLDLTFDYITICWLMQWCNQDSLKTHGSESRGQYSRMHAAINNDVITTCEYFTGRNLVQIQPSESLPSLTLSLWNFAQKLTISQATITEIMKQICADLSQFDIADIKGTVSFFFRMLVSGKYHALRSAFQALIASHRL